MRAVIYARSWLLHAESNAAQSVNGISPPLMAAHGITRVRAVEAVRDSLDAAHVEVIAAHRAEFDRSFLPELADRPWLCTKFDVEWPGVPLGASLNETSLALLGYATRGHRALADCLTLARCFERAAELTDLDAMLARAMRPKVLVEVADKSFDAERNALAKKYGFAWSPDARAWRRRVAIEDAEQLPFRVIEVTP